MGGPYRDLYALIMISSMLNFVTALTACGRFAGRTMVSPCFTLKLSPAISMSASPSLATTSASNGAVCSLRPSPTSKANSVTVPAVVLEQHLAHDGTILVLQQVNQLLDLNRSNFIVILVVHKYRFTSSLLSIFSET